MPNLMKPQEHGESYTVMENAPYEIEGDSPIGMTSDGGVIGKGQVVWVRKQSGERFLQAIVSAYTEKLGMISLDSRFLMATPELVLPSLGGSETNTDWTDTSREEDLECALLPSKTLSCEI